MKYLIGLLLVLLMIGCSDSIVDTMPVVSSSSQESSSSVGNQSSSSNAIAGYTDSCTCQQGTEAISLCNPLVTAIYVNKQPGKKSYITYYKNGTGVADSGSIKDSDVTIEGQGVFADTTWQFKKTQIKFSNVRMLYTNETGVSFIYQCKAL